MPSRVIHHMRHAVHIARSIAAYGFLALYTLVVGPPALVISRLTNRERFVLAAGLAGIKGHLALAGVRSRLTGGEQLQRHRATVYCVNHTSYLDVVAFVRLYSLCPELRILYKRELRRLPIVGSVFAAAGFVPIDRHDHDQAVQALDSGSEALRAGRSLLAAPEGTRNRGTLLPFKKGVFVMAIKAGAPIVPVAIVGTGTALPKGRAIIEPGDVVICVGSPIDTIPFGYEGRDRLIADVRAAIVALLSG